MNQLFRSMVDGFMDGFMEGAAHRVREAVPSWHGDKIDALCRELSWPVDERDGNTVCLHFTDPAGERRGVYIEPNGESAGVFVFCCFSNAVKHPEAFPAEVPLYLLVRNWEMCGGAWSGNIDAAGSLRFCAEYVALAAGLNAAAFRNICEGLVNEVAAFDVKLRMAGVMA
jgi:hypothetical protein